MCIVCGDVVVFRLHNHDNKEPKKKTIYINIVSWIFFFLVLRGGVDLREEMEEDESVLEIGGKLDEFFLVDFVLLTFEVEEVVLLVLGLVVVSIEKIYFNSLLRMAKIRTGIVTEGTK